MMNKTIIFDWGGVILKEYPEHYCDRDAIVETFTHFNSKLSKDDAYNIYLHTLKDESKKIISIFDDYENKHKWYERVNKEAKLNTTYDEFVNEFTKNYVKVDKYEEVVNYIYSLKGKVNLALFSDLIFVCFESLKNQIDLNTFNNVFLSFKEGYIKTYEDAFENVENKLKVNPKDILFIDNNETNIENARKRGWNTCLATGKELDKIKEAVSAFLKE